MLERIEKVIREYKGDEDLAISRKTTFEELDLDSLDIVELVMSLEEEFGVTLEMNENIKSVGSLMDILENV